VAACNTAAAAAAAAAAAVVVIPKVDKLKRAGAKCRSSAVSTASLSMPYFL